MPSQTTYNQNLTQGFAGQVLKADPGDIRAMTNNEASASAVMGNAVAFEGSTDDKGALNPDATTDVIAGIVAHSHGYSQTPLGGDLDASGNIKPGAVLNVVRRGRMLVACEDGCSPGDRLFIRAVAAGAEVEGALRASADSTDCIDSTNQGVWMSTASAGGLAELEFDFTVSPTVDEAEA